MPTISMFYGIIISIFFEIKEKHHLPHIRVPWVRLKSGNAFQGAFVENGTVVWPGNIDIDPETLYEYSVPLAS